MLMLNDCSEATRNKKKAQTRLSALHQQSANPQQQIQEKAKSRTLSSTISCKPHEAASRVLPRRIKRCCFLSKFLNGAHTRRLRSIASLALGIQIRKIIFAKKYVEVLLFVPQNLIRFVIRIIPEIPGKHTPWASPCICRRRSSRARPFRRPQSAPGAPRALCCSLPDPHK